MQLQIIFQQGLGMDGETSRIDMEIPLLLRRLLHHRPIRPPQAIHV